MSLYANVFFTTICVCLLQINIQMSGVHCGSAVRIGQALPGFLLTAPLSVCVSTVLDSLAVWIQNQTQKKSVGVDFSVHLKRRPANLAGPSPIWMHGRNRVSGKPVPDGSYPGCGAGAIMRPVLRCSRGLPSVEDGNDNTSNCPTGHHALSMHGTAIYMTV